MMLGVCEFGTGLHSLIIKKSLMDKLSAPGLYCKIVLSESDFRLARVAILRHKIASVAGEHNVIYLTLST